MPDTSQILENHLAAFLRGDLEGVLADYAPDAVFFTAQGPRVGPGAIRQLFVPLIEEFRKPGAAFHLQSRSVVDDHGYITWTADTPDNRYEMATDTFAVRAGKIVAQSFTAKVVPKAG